jgi:aminoglycoside phosphotransferase (APT) family kinase protein
MGLLRGNLGIFPWPQNRLRNSDRVRKSKIRGEDIGRKRALDRRAPETPQSKGRWSAKLAGPSHQVLSTFRRKNRIKKDGNRLRQISISTNDHQGAETPAVADLRPVKEFVRRSGLVDPLSHLQFQRLTGGVSSDIWLVSRQSGSFCVKRALPQLRVAADWHAPVQRNTFEAAWFRTVGAFMPESVPKILYEEQDRAMFAMEYLSPDKYDNWKQLLARGVVHPETAADVGTRLARIHSVTAQSESLRQLFATGAIFHAIRIEPYLLATAGAHPEIAEKLNALAERTERTKLALVHGDVSPKNILIGPEAPVFIDAECAWYGDPAFDLCFCLNHLLLKCIMVPPSTVEFLNTFRLMSRAYLSEVAWEDPQKFEERVASLLPGLLLARVDGKSPVEYVNTDRQRNIVRRFTLKLLLEDSPRQLFFIADMWARALGHAF